MNRELIEEGLEDYALSRDEEENWYLEALWDYYDDAYWRDIEEEYMIYD